MNTSIQGDFEICISVPLNRLLPTIIIFRILQTCRLLWRLPCLFNNLFIAKIEPTLLDQMSPYNERSSRTAFFIMFVNIEAAAESEKVYCTKIE